MEKMLSEICAYLNNYFPREKIVGTFKIEDGTITVPHIKDGQYFRIINSVFSDGVHKYPVSDLADEEFEGAIWLMAVPQAVIDLSLEADSWLLKYGSTESEAMSPFTSESFGNYSYMKGVTSSSSGASKPMGWQDVFASRLAPYRKLRNIQ